MKRTRLTKRIAAALLACGFAFSATGCDRDVASQVATVSAAYLGDLVTLLTTEYWHAALGVEDGDTHDEHSHDEESLHNHEH